MRSFWVALSFLTILPIRFREPPTERDVARSRFWFPAAAVLLGAGLGGLTRALTIVGAPPLEAFLVLAAWVIATGGLHLDGLCDLCDGLGGGRTREDRLRIMKDPHLGTFGLAGGGLLLLGKFVALQELLTYWQGGAPWLVGLAVVVGRCLALWLAAGSRYPRPEGTGKALIGAAGHAEGLVYGGIALAAVAATPWLTGLPISLAVLFPPLIVHIGLRLLCQRKLGGVTGDCLGADIEVTELLFLFTAALLRLSTWFY